MRALLRGVLLWLVAGASACSVSAPDDGGSLGSASGGAQATGTGEGGSGGAMTTSSNASSSSSTSGGQGGAGGGATDCAVDGNPGTCIDVAACATMADHTSTPGFCPGPQNIECCTLTPNVADNPPIPTGYKLMMQAEVTPEMTSWAVAILNDPTTYPMFATAMMTFGSLMVLARVEWHPPDFNNGVVHRGVTLYEPI